jgi:hypothetical protein
LRDRGLVLGYEVAVHLEPFWRKRKGVGHLSGESFEVLHAGVELDDLRRRGEVVDALMR